MSKPSAAAIYARISSDQEGTALDLRDGLRDGVIVYHQDRLTRRPIELEQFDEVIEAAGVEQRCNLSSGP